MVRTRCYRDGELLREGFGIDEVSDLIADPANVVWLDFFRPDAEDMTKLGDELGLHHLAIEDVLQGRQRPKLDHYPEHLFLVAYAVALDSESGALTKYELDGFITRQCLVTVRDDDGFAIDQVLERWDDAAQLAASGVPFLLHGLLDYLVDTHFAAVERLDDAVEGLEDRLFDETPSDTQMQRRTYQLRKSLVNLRRVVLPMREVVNSLMRRDLRIVDDATSPYFQDVYDHVLRVGEWTDSLRDLIANLTETRLTIRSNRLNVIMKKVTSWAAIIAVPTAVTGYYGQNLPFPGSGEPLGVWVSAGVMIACSLTLYIVFKIKDWL
jgi:magnesium transporter